MDEHAATIELAGEGLELRGECPDVGGDEVVGNDLPEVFEPEKRNLGEDAAFLRDPRAEDVIEGGYAVGGYKEQIRGGVGGEGINIADLAAGGEGKRSELGAKKSLVGCGLGHRS